MIRGTTSGNNNVTFMIHSRNLWSATKKMFVRVTMDCLIIGGIALGYKVY